MSSNLTGLLIRFALFFEPISPPFFSYLLRRRLKGLKDRGLIDGYTAVTRRIGRFHYKIDIDLEVNARQAERMMEDMFTRSLKTFGR